jgi:hypothetical protein
VDPAIRGRIAYFPVLQAGPETPRRRLLAPPTNALPRAGRSQARTSRIARHPAVRKLPDAVNPGEIVVIRASGDGGPALGDVDEPEVAAEVGAIAVSVDDDVVDPVPPGGGAFAVRVVLAEFFVSDGPSVAGFEDAVRREGVGPEFALLGVEEVVVACGEILNLKTIGEGEWHVGDASRRW